MTKQRKEPVELSVRKLDLRISRLERDLKLISNILKFLLSLFISLDEATGNRIKEHFKTLELISHE